MLSAYSMQANFRGLVRLYLGGMGVRVRWKVMDVRSYLARLLSGGSFAIEILVS
jgi:hypothetical protein